MNQTIFTRIGWLLCEKTGHLGAWRGGWVYNGQYHRDCKLCGRIISEDRKKIGGCDERS